MSPDELLALASSVAERSGKGEEIEVACSAGESTSVRVYGGKLESLTIASSQAIGVRVLVEGREGFASAGTLDPDSVEAVLSEARDNARFAEADRFMGIAQPDGVEAVDVDLWSDEVLSTSNEDKIAIAIEAEQRVRDADSRITGVRVSAYGDSAGSFALASTAGIRACTSATFASLSIQALAQDDGARTQTGFASDGARKPSDLDLDAVSKRAVSQTLDLLGASQPKTATVDLVLDPRLAATVLGLIAGTLTGDRILKGRSPFVDRVGEQVASPLLSFLDDPTDPKSLGADAYDGEGLACRAVPLVEQGVLQGYLHDSYTGRRSGHGSTGSAVRGTRGLPSPGLHAMAVRPGSGTLDELIGQVDKGVLVFSLAGLHSGVNPVSGDFSVGIEGRMIRNGRLAEPIAECTVASTLQRLLLDVAAVGGEVSHLPMGVSTPPVVIGGVSLSGA